MAFVPKRVLDVGEVTPIPAHDGEGGLNFTPNGIIGKFASGVFSLFHVDSDPAQFKADLVVTNPNSGKHALYFKERAKAEAAAKLQQQLAGLEKPPILNEVWRLSAPVSSLKNVDQTKFDKSPTLSFDTRVVGLRSERRHTYQLMALPGAVMAVAKYAGIELDLPNPLLELVVAKPEEFTEEFTTRLIGIPKANKGEAGYWTESELGLWRGALWNALGEPDVTKLHNGAKPTEAEELLYCLSMVGAWKNAQWCRVVQVSDPGADAVYNDKRQRVAVVWEFFADEKEATDVGKAELEKRAANAPAEPEPVADGAEPNLPPEWAGFHDDWIANLTESLAKPGVEGRPRDDRDVAADLTVGLPFVKSWKKFLGK